MDEIIIEEKKYISSKQAAKVTGYAKDYIGQLCREGRVPARLVGRSWYVLESAVQDHRFGPVEDTKEEAVTAAKKKEEISSTWESPRYEAIQSPTFPSINRLEESEEGGEAADTLQESWRAWFEKTAQHIENTDDKKDESHEPALETEDAPETTSIEEMPAMSIPLRTMDSMEARRIVLKRSAVMPKQPLRDAQEIMPTTGWDMAIRGAGIFVAMLFVALVAVGSGYFDSFITSGNRAGYLTGTVLYSR